MARERPDPWHPMARLAINALTKVLARYPNIRSIMDIGCGDMGWMQYFLKDHPQLTYVGVDIQPFCLYVNFRRFPNMQYIQTDISNTRGIEVLPQGIDLVICKELFNQMALPDAVDALRRVVATRPRFLMTDNHTQLENEGWEQRIDKHLEYTAYNYNRAPFWMPYPMCEVQRINDQQNYVLYQITPDLRNGALPHPAMVQDLELPRCSGELDGFLTVADGEWTEPKVETAFPAASADAYAPAPLQANEPLEASTKTQAYDELGPRPAPVDDSGEGPAEGPMEGPAGPPSRPIKGIPAAEFRARCDLIFEKMDKDQDNVLNYQELVALMDAGGRRIEEHSAYMSLCSRLGCDGRVGLERKHVYKLFEKAPQSVWEEVYRSINPVAQLVKKGAESLPDTFLERTMTKFILEDSEEIAKVQIELNAHLYFGAAEVVEEKHVQAYFGKQRIEVHIVAPGSYTSKDLYLWKLVITPLNGEIVPEDCTLDFKVKDGNIAMMTKKVIVKLVKSKKRKWKTLGQA